jgi:cyclopropane fatty-acyl-phospholipid synthase-like methyltransferase
MTDPRLFAPAAARNRGPILDVLREILPDEGRVLEIASGTGEHVTHFAAHLPGLTFQPSDPGAEARASIAAWIAETGAKNILAPLALDAAATLWPIAKADAIVCINMIHISPWAATEGLFAGARNLLPAGASLYLYGPYKRGGAHTAASNVAFDESLRAQNPEWGVRDIETVAACAKNSGFSGPQIVAMPADNLSVVFRRL